MGHKCSGLTNSKSGLCVGYQSMGILGRQIVDGAEKVRILGREYLVKAISLSRLNLFVMLDYIILLTFLDSCFRRNDKSHIQS